jgi:aminotransferase
MKLSQRSSDITQSEIRAISIAINNSGGNAINLAQGICDTAPPNTVLQGASDAIFAGKNLYTRHDGIDSLREAIAMKQQRDYDVTINPKSEIVITCGASGAFYGTIMALLDPGDEVAIFEPYYSYHVTQLQSIGVKSNFIRLTEPEWNFTDEQLEAAITPKTRAILVNTPGNPSGKVFTREEFMRIGHFAEKHDLIIISDEIYEYFVYEGVHVTPVSIPELRPRTVVIGGFSKTFSITGWRIGYAIAPPEVIAAIGHLSDLVYVCAPAPLQVGVAQGIMELSTQYYEELRDDHLVKRDMICASLIKAGLNPTICKGAYYLLCDVSKIKGDTCRDKAMKLLEMTGIGGVPGSAFFHDNSGDHLIRFCFAKEMHVIEECCKRFEALELE